MSLEAGLAPPTSSLYPRQKVDEDSDERDREELDAKPSQSTQNDYLDERDDLDGDDNEDEEHYKMPSEVMQLVQKRMEETSKEKERGGFE